MLRERAVWCCRSPNMIFYFVESLQVIMSSTDRCQAITKRGKQCRRRALPDTRFCKQHEEEQEYQNDTAEAAAPFEHQDNITVHVSTGAAKSVDARWLKQLIALLSSNLGAEDENHTRELRDFVVYAVDNSTEQVVGYVFYSPGSQRISNWYGRDALLTKMLSHVYVELEQRGKQEVYVKIDRENKTDVARYIHQGFTTNTNKDNAQEIALVHLLHPLSLEEVEAAHNRRRNALILKRFEKLVDVDDLDKFNRLVAQIRQYHPTTECWGRGLNLNRWIIYLIAHSTNIRTCPLPILPNENSDVNFSNITFRELEGKDKFEYHVNDRIALAKTIRNCKSRIIALDIRLDSDVHRAAHANVLILDLVDKTYELFDPNGGLHPFFKGETQNSFQKVLKSMALRRTLFQDPGKWKFIATDEVCPNFGPQAKQAHAKDDSCVDGGFCMVYSIMYAHLRLLMTNTKPSILQEFWASVFTVEEHLDIIKRYMSMVAVLSNVSSHQIKNKKEKNGRRKQA